MRKIWKYLAVSGALLLVPVSVQAQQVIITGELLPLHVSETVDSEKMTIPVSELDILGKIDEEHVMVLVDKNFLYADLSELSEQLPLFDMDSLPEAEGMQTYKVGSNGDGVKVIQQQLKDLGYLEWNVDGDFGAGTGAALYNWQAAEGFQTNGVADIPMQWVLQEKAAAVEPVELYYPTEISAEAKYGDLAGKVTGIDMELLAVPAWHYTFDQESGSGCIDPGVDFGMYEVTEPAVDRIKLSAGLFVDVIMTDAGADLVPVLRADSEGAFRPYMEKMILKGSGKEVSLSAADVTAQAGEGISMLESTSFELTQEAAELIRTAGDSLTIEITGAVSNYEITSDEALEKAVDTLDIFTQAGVLK